MVTEILLVLLCGILLLWAGRLLLGQLLLPVQDLTILIPAQGDGSTLEHTVKGLDYLSSAGLLESTCIYLNDTGLDAQGRLVASRLCRQYPRLQLCVFSADAVPIPEESRCSPSNTKMNNC